MAKAKSKGLRNRIFTQQGDCVGPADIGEGIAPPNLSIAGIPLTVENMSIAFPPGAFPYQFNVRLFADEASAIFKKSANKPVAIKAKYNEATEKWDKTFKNWFVLRRSDDGVWLNTLKISDPRYLWANRVIVGRFNWRYQINAFMIANWASQDIPDQGGVVGEEGINYGAEGDKGGGQVFKDRFVIPKYAILPPTMKNGKDKWKAVELIDLICQEFLGNEYWGGFIAGSGGKAAAGGNVNRNINNIKWSGSDVTPENILFDATPVPMALNYLLQISRSQMNFFPDGKVYVYDMADDNIVYRLDKAGLQGSSKESYAKWKTLIDTDDRFINKKYGERERPAKYNVYFDKEIETPFVFEYGADLEEIKRNNQKILDTAVKFLDKEKAIGDELAKKFGIRKSQASGNQPVIPKSGKKVEWTGKLGDMFATGSLINVGRWPFVSIPKSPKWTDRDKLAHTGEYVPIDILIEEIGLTQEFMLEHWFRDVWKIYAFTQIAQVTFAEWLEKNIIKDYDHAVLPRFIAQYCREANTMVNEIARSWWRTFMIHPSYREKIVSWSAKRAAIADRVSGYRVWAPVHVNYTSMPTIYSMWEGEEVQEPSQINLDINDKTVAQILGRNMCPFKINVEDQALGVFNLEQVTDFHNVYYGFEMGTFGTEVKSTPPTTPETDTWNWFQCPKEAKLKLVTLLNIKYIIPNDKRLMYCLEIPPNNPGIGPPVDIYCRREPARFVWKSSYANPEDILTNPPINDGILKLFAHAEINIKEFELQDWNVGTLKLMGVHNIDPFGNALITYHFEDGECSTIIDMMQPPEPPDLYPALPRDSRQALWGELGAWYNK